MGKDTETVKLTVPLEMVITKKEREGVPTADAIAKQKSLKEKLQEHYTKKKERKSDVLRNILTPDFVNRFAVPVYLFTVGSAWKIAFFDVMPQMYEGNETMIFWQRVLSVVLLFEIMSNWMGIRYVDSTYTRLLTIQRKEKEAKENSPHEGIQGSSKEKEEDSSCAQLMQTHDGNQQQPPSEEAKASASSSSSPKNDNKNKKANVSTTTTTTTDPKLLLMEAAQKANMEMELRNQQRRSISDLVKSSSDSIEDDNAATTKNSKTSPSATGNNSNSKSKASSAKGSSKDAPVDKVKSPVISKKNNTVTYPYWSWVPCFDCNRTRPPRCHHCPVCRDCVLKRDHHCFFAGNCVGYRNHRYFYAFVVWAWVCSVYSTLHGFPYIYMFLWDDMSYFDVFMPIVLTRWILGYVSFQAALCVTTLSCVVYFDLVTSTFIYTHTQLIRWGLTSFEKVFLKRTLEIKDTRSLNNKIRAVFGRNWALNIIMPMSWLYDVEEDPVEWPHVEVIKHKK